MPDEPGQPADQNNIDRLLKHLKVDSLASRLVKAHPNSDNPTETMQEVLADRLELMKAKLDGTTD